LSIAINSSRGRTHAGMAFILLNFSVKCRIIIIYLQSYIGVARIFSGVHKKVDLFLVVAFNRRSKSY